MFRSDFGLNYLSLVLLGKKEFTDDYTFEDLLKEVSELVVETHCLDDFAGNNYQDPCWADSYKTKSGDCYIVANAAYQYDKKTHPEVVYVVKVSNEEYDEINASAEFDYELLKKGVNLVSIEISD